jgi:hypothetical protein
MGLRTSHQWFQHRVMLTCLLPPPPAQAFAVINQQGGNSVNAWTSAVAQAISQGGGAATESYAQAFAQAAAAGGDQRTGLAQATAVAFCEGACL